MTVRLRTGYSFRQAVGRIDDVISRLKEIGATHAPITDTASTFGWVRWKKACKTAGLIPVFGVELAVTKSINEKKPSIDHWTFIAKDSLVPIHELIGLATSQFRYQPLLTVEQAWARSDVYAVMGYRTDFSSVPPSDHVMAALSPSIVKGQVRSALDLGHRLVASSDNRYPRIGGKGLYETIAGRNSSTQSYPQHILSDEEWLKNMSRLGMDEEVQKALSNRMEIFTCSSADLVPAEMVHPPRPMSLEEMCRIGAAELECDLTRPVYKERLERELNLIADKQYEDYFYLVADICQWARKRMIVGPARGSSCGSLVCYLLRITSVDPIPFGLIFERFIDVNRSDIPDIDIDFPEHIRHEVFEYVAQKYGKDKVARLGTVAMYQPRSALKEAAGALDIRPWLLNPVLDAIIERSSGDARALQATEDTLKDTEAGREFLNNYPEILVAAEMEGHPRHAGQHAAGIVITEQPIHNYVAIDQRTGATMCDKKDAEELNLLKIDALGLTQLSIFQHALYLAGLPRDYLFSLSFDDPEAFKVLNDKKYSGIFQFNGLALQSITDQITVSELNDIVAITALARPGPLNSGGTNHWVKAHSGKVQPTYPHPSFEPILKDTLGVVAYQEQVMVIGREIGGLSWEDVTALRKAMSKSLGAEFFDKYGDRWKEGARSKGVPEETLTKVWDDLCAYGSWAFNKCISGEMKIKLAQTGSNIPKEMTIAQAYDFWVAHPSSWMKKNKSMPILASIFPDGRGYPQKAVTIHKNGIRSCWKYVFDDGSEVICTPDHKFIIDGEWKKASEAKLGSKWTSLIYEKQDERNGRGKGHSKGRKYKEAQEGHYSGEDNIAWVNGASKFKDEFSSSMEGKPCIDCGNNHQRMEIHHLDFNHGKDRPKDMVWLCPSCHKKRHYNNGRRKRFEKGYIQSTKTLVKSEFNGDQETYDIEMPDHHNYALDNGLVTHNSHAVAYGIVSYWCCWLKAHYPLEFAAATLSYTDSPETQIKLLRELAAEGVEYLAADIDYSSDKWTVKKGGNWNHLVGPLDNVLGVGPKMMSSIMAARARSEPIPERARKLLENPKTKIDSLYPVRDAFQRLLPNPKEANIISKPVPIKDIQFTGENYEVMVFCVMENIKPRDENEAMTVAKRGGRIMPAPTAYLNLRLADDTDVIFAKIDRWNYERIGRGIVERGRSGKSLYAIKGQVPKDFRMIRVQAVKYIGDMEKGKEQ